MMLEHVIATMRANWVVVEQDRIDCGDWTQADADEVGAEIKAAIQAGDEAVIGLWARWLADLAAIALGLRVGQASRRIAAEVRAARQARQGAQA